MYALKIKDIQIYEIQVIEIFFGVHGTCSSHFFNFIICFLFFKFKLSNLFINICKIIYEQSALLFTKGSIENLNQEEEDASLKNIIYDVILYSLVPLQYFIVVYFLYNISDDNLTIGSKIGMTIALGLSCGILGINAAHELGHRSTRYEQLMSKMLLLTSILLSTIADIIKMYQLMMIQLLQNTGKLFMHFM